MDNEFINILIPTTPGRYNRLLDTINSISDGNYPYYVIHKYTNNIGYVKAVKFLLEHYEPEDIVFIVNDDVKFEKDSLKLMYEAFNKDRTKIYQPNDGIWLTGGCATFPLALKSTILEYMCFEYYHYCADLEMHARALKDNRFEFVENAKVTHLHPCRFPEFQKDETYRIEEKFIEKDDLLYYKRKELYKF